MNNNQNGSNLSNMYGVNNGAGPNQEDNTISNQATNINNATIESSSNNLSSNSNINNQNNNIIQEQPSALRDNSSINSGSINQNLNVTSSNVNVENNYPGNINQDPMSEQKKNEMIDNYINPGPSSTQTQPNNNTSNTDEWLKAYIGKNYEKIMNSNISIPAFFFAEYYWFYRKMFLFGLVLGIIRILVFNSPLGILSLGINVICIFITNKVYLIDTKYKISKIKSKMFGKSNQEILNACASKGGTSIGLTVGGAVIEIISIMIYLIIGLITGISAIFNTDFLTNLFSDINININSSSSDESTNPTYDGVLTFDVNVNITDKVSVNVPTVFEDESMDSHEYAYTYNSNPSDVFGDCSFSLNVVSNYTDAENLATGMAEYYNGNTNIINTNVNGINWYGLNYSSVYNTTAYLMELDNQVYLYEFKIGDDSDQAACNTYNEQIFNSISLK